MKSRLDYRTKRIVIIAIIAVILFAIASISTFFFIKGNDKTQAAELDSMTASEQKNTQEQKNEEGTTQTTVPSGDTQSEQTSEEQTNDTTEVATTQTTPAMQIENDGTNGTQTTNANVGLQENTTTRTETQLVENKTVLLGFNQEDINVDINAVSNLSSNLPQIDKEITASNLNGILSGAEITYEIKITNQNAEIVNQLNVSALIPEGTELVADSISDNGICENGKISWKVDVNTEKTVKFTVKVIAEEGVISANAVVEGKETETIQTPILKATLTVDKTEVSKNETLIYTVSVENTANIPAEIKVEATIPENTQLETEGLDVTDKTINWNKTLEALEKVEYSYTVKVNKYEKNYVIENVVKVNEAETNKVSTAIVDKIPPKITVKGDEEPDQKYIGDEDRKIFSKVSFKLYDENGVVAYKINDGEYTTFTVSNYSDANFDNIKSRLVYGKNTITLKDVAGNEATYEFVYDNKAPTITVKGDEEPDQKYIGDEDRKIFSKVSFKLYDEYGVVAYKINNGEYKTFTVSNYSDANFENIKSRLVYGKNTITLKDVAGNEATYEFVYDNEAPVIKINGSKEITLEAGIDTYEELGATVTDNIDETIDNLQPDLIHYYTYNKETGKYVFSTKVDSVDTNKIGLYKVSYTYTDTAGNKGVNADNKNSTSVIRFVYVVDTTAPVIKINGNKEITLEAGIDTYEELGATVTDNVDETIGNLQPDLIHYYTYNKETGEYKFSTKVDSVDTSKVGLYKVSYTYTDEAGNKGVNADNKNSTSVIRFVYVVDTTAPLLNLNGDKNITLEAGIDTYEELGVTVVDNVDPIITDLQPSYINYSVNGNFVGKVDKVDTTKLGTYKVVYEYTDVAGNKGVDALDLRHEYVIRTIIVQDTIIPTAEVSFSTTDPTNKLFVTLKFSEKIDETTLPQGFYPVAGQENTYSKAYYSNKEHTVTFKDMAGNEGSVTFTITNIDSVAPTATVTFSNNNGNQLTNQDVTVTLTANESIKDIGDGWIRVDDKTFNKIYSENGKYSVEIEDEAGNKSIIKYEVKRIDKVTPEATATFSNNNGAALTQEDVTVTLTANESIKDIGDGWTRVDDKTFTKIYSENGKYSVEIEDKAGNKNTINYEVKRIDRKAPEATVTFSNNNGAELTNQDVIVTLTANETIRDIEGWNRVNDRTFTKVYSENGKHDLEIVDKIGNKNTIHFEVKRIDKIAPTAQITISEDSESGKIIATLTADESIKDIGDEWVRSTDKVFTKEVEYGDRLSVNIQDKAGNTNTINYEVNE